MVRTKVIAVSIMINKQIKLKIGAFVSNTLLTKVMFDIVEYKISPTCIFQMSSIGLGPGRSGHCCNYSRL